MSHHRVVILKDLHAEDERLLPIWIGPFEADAITVQLQGQEVARPLTHDLLKSTINTLGATVSHIFIHDLSENTFFARIVMRANGEDLEVDSRPSDAIALAVRTQSPIYVDEEVLNRASITPSPDISTGPKPGDAEKGDDAFRDFVEGLDLDGLEEK